MTKPTSNPSKPPISVLILAREQALAVEGALRSALTWSDDVVLLDAMSRDKTAEIAKTFPAVRLIQRRFDNIPAHRTFALREITYRHPWVLILEADERVSDSLVQEMVAAITAPGKTCDGYQIWFDISLNGLPAASSFNRNEAETRLIRPQQCQFDSDHANSLIPDGNLGQITGAKIQKDLAFAGLKRWFDALNEASDSLAQISYPRLLGGLGFGIPGWTPWGFMRLWTIVGRDWFRQRNLFAMYHYWIDVKIREREQNWHDRTKKTVERLLVERPR